MTLDARRTALWQALDLGPLWRRHPSAPTTTAAAAGERIRQAAEPTATSRAEQPTARAVAPPVDEAPHQLPPVAGADWEQLARTVAGCTACSLCRTRTQTVFGVGARDAQWMLVGEAPGADEDARGEPFVGQAGKLLDNMLAALGLTRGSAAAPAQSVYIANVLKCRPPNNRNPEPGEVARCEPFLQRQVALLQPRLIVVMGRFAAQSLLATDGTIASLRGRLHHYEVDGRRVPVVVTYHPAYLLRNLADKAKSWADLCLAKKVFDAAAEAPRP